MSPRQRKLREFARLYRRFRQAVQEAFVTEGIAPSQATHK
jgi:hypothetical protein